MMTDPKQLEAAAGVSGAELGEGTISDPDQLLMMRARDGDLDAFHQLFKKYQTPILN